MEVEAALERLIEFAASWNEGEVIDKPSGLTADDLECLIEWMKSARAGPR